MKILFIDVETSPHLSAHFGRWNQNIQPEWTVEESRIVCFAAKWAHERKVTLCDVWGLKKGDMHQKLWELLDEADVVIGYNSDKFDIKRINTELVTRGYGPPSPYAKLDLFKQVKKHFGFSSNKLKHVLKELGLAQKLEEGVDKELWMDACFRGVRKQQRNMLAYNSQDVFVTEGLYEYMLGWIDNHPNWGLYLDDTTDDKPLCPNCGSDHMVKHKIRRTKVRRYQQWKCESCGSYHRGRKSLPDKEGILC